MYVVKLEEAERKEEFGFKAAALSDLKRMGLPVPDGFVISPSSLDFFIASNNIRAKIAELSETNDSSPAALKATDDKIRELFIGAVIPSDLRKEIVTAYNELSLSEDVMKASAALSLIRAGRDSEMVSVRSSVKREPENSFAGITDIFVNVNGEDDLFRHIKLCWASLFSPYVRIYRQRRGLEDTSMSVIVQKMADSEKSGLILTNFGDVKFLVEAAWGIGSIISSGAVTPDEYLLDSGGHLIDKNISKKMWMFSRNEMSGLTLKEHVPGNKMDAQVLSEVELKKLFELATKVKMAYAGQQIIDWSIGRNRAVITDVKPGNYDISPEHEENPTGEILVTGRYVSRGNVAGTVKNVRNNMEGHFTDENIAVIGDSDSKDLLAAGNAGGFVTDEGGRLCNFSILARELNMPVLSATRNGTSVLREDERVRLVAQHGKVISEPQIESHAPEGNIMDVPQFPLSEPDNPLEQVETGESHGFESPFPTPFEQTPNESSEATDVQMGTRIFAKVGPDMIGKVPGVNGFIVYNIPSQPEMLVEHPQSQEAHAIWLSSSGEDEMQKNADIARRLVEQGRNDTGMFVPVVRGRDDINRFRYHLPAGVKFGVSIKTPSMALQASEVINEDTSAVNIEIDPLMQLSMGLKNPDQNIHETVLELIGKVKERCREADALCCVTLSQGYVTDWNIEMLVRKGVDAVCVEAGMIENVKGILSRIQSEPTQQPAVTEDLPFVDEVKDAPEAPFDFSPSSFSGL